MIHLSPIAASHFFEEGATAMVQPLVKMPAEDVIEILKSPDYYEFLRGVNLIRLVSPNQIPSVVEQMFLNEQALVGREMCLQTIADGLILCGIFAYRPVVAELLKPKSWNTEKICLMVMKCLLAAQSESETGNALKITAEDSELKCIVGLIHHPDAETRLLAADVLGTQACISWLKKDANTEQAHQVLGILAVWLTDRSPDEIYYLAAERVFVGLGALAVDKLAYCLEHPDNISRAGMYPSTESTHVVANRAARIIAKIPNPGEEFGTLIPSLIAVGNFLRGYGKVAPVRALCHLKAHLGEMHIPELAKLIPQLPKANRNILRKVITNIEPVGIPDELSSMLETADAEVALWVIIHRAAENPEACLPLAERLIDLFRKGPDFLLPMNFISPIAYLALSVIACGEKEEHRPLLEIIKQRREKLESVALQNSNNYGLSHLAVWLLAERACELRLPHVVSVLLADGPWDLW